MGSVHEAEHEGTGERVAVKLIHKSRLAGRGAVESASRFRREARAAAAASGENVVRVIEDGVDEETGDLFIVMELLEGEDLQQLLQRTGPLAPPLALRLVGQALRGLHQAHEAGIVHRDIKPGNIFLARRGGGEMVVKILDFGVAKMMGEGDLAGAAGLTTTGGFLGSPMFMSPEQVKSSKHVDRRADIWAIGSVLYCALSGRAPHEAEATSVGKLILAICNTPTRPIHEIAPWVPLPVSRILERALAIDAPKRYATAEEMLDAIRPFAPDLTLREDMWKDLPVLVTVPPPPPDDGEIHARPAAIEHLSGLAHAETVPQLEAPARLPAPALPGGAASALHGEALAETIPSSRSGEATAGEASSSAPGELAADRASSSHPDRTSAPAPSSSRRDHGAPDSQARSPHPSRPGAGRGKRGAMAVGAALLAGGLIAAVLRPQQGSSHTDHSLSSSPSSSPSSSASTSSSGASPAAEGPMLRLRLRISPADATAFVDGAQALSSEGTVELAGAPGSVHEVRLEKGGGAFRTSVLLTEKGLLPPEIEMVTLPPSPASAVPAASTPGAASRASGDRSPKDAPPPKQPPSANPAPSEPPPVPKPPADDLMHDHR